MYSFLRYLLIPLAWLYHLGTAIRNYLFDIGHYKSFKFDVPVICIGNLRVGGSGKTPMIEYILRRYAKVKNMAVLSRGYKRKTSGYRCASDQDTANTIGDEPFQIYSQFGDRVVVAVGEDKAEAIPLILHSHDSVDCILLDDGFQHRAVQHQLSIVLSDYRTPFFKDALLPFGRLRESRKGAARAGMVVMTKCPLDLSQDDKGRVIEQIRRYTQAPVFFTGLQYEPPVSFRASENNSSMEIKTKVVIVSGLASSFAFENYAKDNFEVIKSFQYKDHHDYSLLEIEKISKFAHEQNADVLTTSKDFAKLIDQRFESVLLKAHWFYLPMCICFLDGEEEFNSRLEAILNQQRSEH